ncbi:MAG TPA: 4Fe-4S binding protein [Kineosporiaceae bacterium]|nr:4Fe-4S binding protein [Kineosporiaceae bacterium]
MEQLTLARPPARPMPSMPIRIDGCQGCGACLLSCPEHALRPVPGGIAAGGGIEVRADRCTGCLECLEICPVAAISGPPTDRGGVS